MKNIILIGFMGVGKTTTGKYLSKMLKYDFIDTDNIIEINEKLTIKNIFNKKGENYFRNLEKNLTREIIKKKYKIVSTGGGLFLDKVNRKILLENDFVVFLNLSIELIYKRIKRNKKRPLLENISFKELKKKLKTRIYLYKNSHLEINCDKKSLAKITNEINLKYNLWLKERIK